MKTMTIGKRIALACIVLVGLTVTLGLVSILSIASIETAAHSLVNDAMIGIRSSTELESIFREQEGVMLRPINDQFIRIWAKIQPLSREMKIKDAMSLWMTEAFPASAAANRLFDDINEFNTSHGARNAAEVVGAAGVARAWALLILAIAVICGAAMALFIVRGVNRGLRQAVTELSEGAEQVSSASGQVSASSQSLAQGASEQAASLEETSATSEEINSMTRKNAENSQQ